MNFDRNGILARTFRTAVKGTVAAVIIAPIAIDGLVKKWDAEITDGTPLTEGEIRVLESIFGDQLDTSVMRKHFGPMRFSYDANGGVRGYTLGTVENGSRQHINFWGEHVHSDDYSQEGERLLSLFVHESTHIWQHQDSWAIFGMFSGCSQYSYELDENSELDDFCVEQQAEIISDYATWILYPEIGEPGIHSENERHLARVVEEVFPRARETRLMLEGLQESSLKTTIYNPAVRFG